MTTPAWRGAMSMWFTLNPPRARPAAPSTALVAHTPAATPRASGIATSAPAAPQNTAPRVEALLHHEDLKACCSGIATSAPAAPQNTAPRVEALLHHEDLKACCSGIATSAPAAPQNPAPHRGPLLHVELQPCCGFPNCYANISLQRCMVGTPVCSTSRKAGVHAEADPPCQSRVALHSKRNILQAGTLTAGSVQDRLL